MRRVRRGGGERGRKGRREGGREREREGGRGEGGKVGREREGGEEEGGIVRSGMVGGREEEREGWRWGAERRGREQALFHIDQPTEALTTNLFVLFLCFHYDHNTCNSYCATYT